MSMEELKLYLCRQFLVLPCVSERTLRPSNLWQQVHHWSGGKSPQRISSIYCLIEKTIRGLVKSISKIVITLTLHNSSSAKCWWAMKQSPSYCLHAKCSFTVVKLSRLSTFRNINPPSLRSVQRQPPS